VLQKVISDPEARELLKQVGERPELRDEVKAAMKTFVLHTMYSENAGVTCGQARDDNSDGSSSDDNSQISDSTDSDE